MKVVNLTKSIDQKKVIKDIDFTIEPGEIVALIGRNGAGKTTLFRTILDLYQKDSGHVYIDEQDICENTFLKNKIFLLDDSLTYFDRYKPRKISLFYQHNDAHFDTAYFQKQLAYYDLPLNKPLQSYSKGMKALFKLLIAFSTSAQYILLDEPFDGLDILIRKQVIRLLLDNVATKNVSILIASHQLNDLESIVDRALILKDHTIVSDYSLENTREKAVKAQLVFRSKEIPTVLKEHGTLLHVQGRVLVYLFENMTPELENKILACEPVLFDKLPLSLEDLFSAKLINEKDYDIMH